MVNQITADELADRMDTGESIVLVDTRSSDSFAAWHVQGAENIPYDPRDGLNDDQRKQVRDIASDSSVTTICGKGLTSTVFASELEQHGFEDVTVVKGGMEDWSKVYEVVPIDTEDDNLVIRQLQRRGKGCLGYVVGSQESGEAVVVDPTRQTGTYEIAAEEAGLTIKHVLDTHIHADHISGGRKLADAIDAPYYLGEKAAERDVAYQYEPLADGDVIEFGGVTIQAIHTPGHTTEMMNYLVNDEYLLTGDTLFVESVGRTELQFGDEGAADGAELLYKTLHEKILPLSGDTQALPGHISVTADGQYEHGTPGNAIEAKLADLRDSLDLLGLDEEAFVDRLVDNAPEKPSNYEKIIAINTGYESPETDGEATELELGPNNCAA